MKKISILLILISFVLSGYAAPKQNAYFTIHYDGVERSDIDNYTNSPTKYNKKIVVTNAYLKPAWYNIESKQKYKPIYQRLENYKKGTFKETFPELYQIVKKLELEINIEPFDGTVHFDPNKEPNFQIIGAKEGRSLDSQKLCSEILAALKTKTHADITVPVIITKPKSAQAVLEQKTSLRAKYSTRFNASNLPRAENIQRSAECFNGLTIEPGAQISFNKIVGARTAARGYQEANIIVDGEFIKGVGGGVCQTSTTLFNAALFSGLSIIKSCNHSLPISYVPIGRDAMVSSAVDLVLENNTGSPIYIESGAEGSRVWFNIYGAKLKVEYKTRIEETEGDEEIRALTYIEAYKGDKLVNSKLIRKSRYKNKKEAEKEIEETIPVPTENLPKYSISGISA